MAKGMSGYQEKYTIVASDGTGERAIKDHSFFQSKNAKQFTSQMLLYYCKHSLKRGAIIFDIQANGEGKVRYAQ